MVMKQVTTKITISIKDEFHAHVFGCSKELSHPAASLNAWKQSRPRLEPHEDCSF